MIRRVLAAALLALAVTSAAIAGGDPLGDAITRWGTMAAEEHPGDEAWEQIAPIARAEIERARAARAVGLPLESLRHAAFAGELLDAAAYARSRPEALHRELAAFDVEWERVGAVLDAELGKDPMRVRAARHAALRAIAERAWSRGWEYWRASRDYARASSTEDGLFYLGSALAQRDLVALCLRISLPATGAATPLPSLAPAIDALESQVLGAYCPPASLERHREFILANAAIKEARELDVAGLHEGALLAYLEAVRAAGELRGPEATAGSATDAELGELEGRLAGSDRDHGIGRAMLEIALGELRLPPRGPRTSAVVTSSVLPRYFAAVVAGAASWPARASQAGEDEPRPRPEVTVTLVRWPYT